MKKVMMIQDWISIHKGGYSIGSIVNSSYVEDYMIVKYKDWLIEDILSNPTYGLWINYVNKNKSRLQAFYNNLYNRNNYDFINTYRQDKDTNTKKNIDGNTIKTPNLTTTHNMGKWEEIIDNTEYRTATNSNVEKEVGKTHSSTTQPITINTDTTTGSEKNEHHDTDISTYTENVSGYNGKTQSQFLIDSYKEMDLNPIEDFIDKFVRGYFICG